MGYRDGPEWGEITLYLQNKKCLFLFVLLFYILLFFYVFSWTLVSLSYGDCIPPFVKLHGCRFLYFLNLFDIRNEVVFLILEHSSFSGVKQKKHKKNHEILAFKPLLQEIWLKNLTSRKIFFEIKKNTSCRSLQKWSEIELYSPLYGFIKIFWEIQLRDSHMKFMGKNKVGNTTWAKSHGLIGQKWQNSFQ